MKGQKELNIPTISIIIPAFNVEKYIIKCLESISSQSFQDFEVIIINDGSIDNTKILVEQFIENKSNFKIINKQNGGVSSARNFGLSKAVGNYISFIDPDDWIVDSMFEVLVSEINKKEFDIGVFGYVRDYANRNSKKSLPLNTIGKNYAVLTGPQIKEEIWRKLIGVKLEYIFKQKEFYQEHFFEGFVWRNIYKSSFIKSNKIHFPPNINFREDEVFNLLAFEKAANVVIFNEVFYHYQIRESSLCTGFKKDYLSVEKTIFFKKQEIIKNSDYRYKNLIIENLNKKFALDTIGLVNNICKIDSNFNWKQRQGEIAKIINDPVVIETFKSLRLLNLVHLKIKPRNFVSWIMLNFIKFRFKTPLNIFFTLWIRLIYKI